jgi:hypothetical protein
METTLRSFLELVRARVGLLQDQGQTGGVQMDATRAAEDHLLSMLDRLTAQSRDRYLLQDEAVQSMGTDAAKLMLLLAEAGCLGD